MDCREFLLRYTEYDDSLIPAEEADRFRRHLAACPSCARYDRVLRKGRMVARQMPRPEPRPDFTVRLQRRLLRTRSDRTSSPTSASLAAGLAAATVILVIASALQVIDPGMAGSGSEMADRAAPGAARGVAPPAGAVAGGGAGWGVEPGALTARLPAGRVPARAWWKQTVAAGGATSYSPLVTGPPVYRIVAAPPEGTTTTQRTTFD